MENQFNSYNGGSVQASPSNQRQSHNNMPQRTPCDMTHDQQLRYEEYFRRIAQQGSDQISGSDAKSLFLKTQMQRDQLSQVWTLTDIDKKGFLYKGEFVVAIHLIGLIKLGVQIPFELPDNLMLVARGGDLSQQQQQQQQNMNNSQVFQQPPQRLASNQNMMVQPRLGSNQNIQPRRLESNSSIQVNQPIQPSQQRFGSNSSIQLNNNLQGFSQGQPQMMQQQMQQPFIPTNPNEIAGWDPLQQQMNMARQQLGTVQSSSNIMNLQLKELFDRVLIEKQQEVSYIVQMTNNYRLLLQQLQEQHNTFSVELSKMESQKQAAKGVLQQVQQQVTQQQQQNQLLQNQFVQQLSHQSLNPPSPGFDTLSNTFPHQSSSNQWEQNQQQTFPPYNGGSIQQFDNNQFKQTYNQNDFGAVLQGMDATQDPNQTRSLQSAMKPSVVVQDPMDYKKTVHFSDPQSSNKNDVTVSQIEVDLNNQMQGQVFNDTSFGQGINQQGNNFNNSFPQQIQNQSSFQNTTPNTNPIKNQMQNQTQNNQQDHLPWN